MDTDNIKVVDPKITNILDDYSNYVTRKEEKRMHEEEEKQKFILTFEEIRERVIRPIFESLVTEATSRHYTAMVETEKEVSDKTRLTQEERFITVILQLTSPDDLRLKYYYNSTYQPHLSFYCDWQNRKVRVHESTIGPGHGGHYGWKSDYDLSQVTESRVRDELLDWLESLIREATLSSYS